MINESGLFFGPLRLDISRRPCPASLVVGFYGMNFAHMPELTWQFGYPMAIVLMGLFAVLPYVYFRHRRWL